MYATEEERMKSLRASRNKYQKNKEWYCDICKNGKNYTNGGRTSHEKTQKHQRNLLSSNYHPKEMKTEFVNNLITF